MIPDLGEYFMEVTSAYGVSLMALIWVSFVYIRRSRSIKLALDAAEARKDA
ncbi:MAG: heme exporter protein CcmD [Planktomarina sp.]|nr:heme exporter protein CcmD [Planktomarina sp.]|tara:strand:+ start:1365 stop:1517 length:153 start_codon:yes stop_codon:yes gene_type:complete